MSDTSLFFEMQRMSITLRIAALEGRGGPDETDWEWVRLHAHDSIYGGPEQPVDRSELVCAGRRGKKEGEVAAGFNNIARAVAILSFMPGGISIFGHHFTGRTLAGERERLLTVLSRISQVDRGPCCG